jgi:hypothetical protein
MASAKKVVEPEEAMQIVEPVSNIPAPPPPKTAPVESVPKTSWRFVDNINPDQTIIFEDGAKFTFGGKAEFITKDAELAKKIEKVMDRYRIFHG